MDKVELEFEFAINSPEAKAEAEQVKKAITGVGDTAEQQAKRVESSVKRISILDDASLASLKKARDAKQAVYDEAAKSLGGKTPEVKTPDANKIKDVADEVINLKKANEESNEVNKEGGSIIGDLIGSVFSWGGALAFVGGLIVTYKDEIIAWTEKVIFGKEENEKLAKSIEATSEALASSEYAKALTTLEELKQEVADAKDGFLDKEKVVEHYNETMGRTAGVVSKLDEVQQKLTQNGDAYVQNILNQATANIVLEEAIKKSAEAEQRRLNGPTFGDKVKGVAAVVLSAFNPGNKISASDHYNNQLKRSVNYDADNLEKESFDALEAYKKKKAEADKYAKENGLNVFDDTKVAKQSKATIDDRKSLLARLEALDKEYSRKSFTKDAEEIQALKDKFSKIRGLILDFNNKNPKRAISLVALNETEKIATNDLGYRQETDRAKTSLDEQKKLYADYEAYKTKFGEAKAKERFKTEIKTNAELLKKLAVDSAMLTVKANTVGISAPEKERLAQNKKDMAELQSLEDKRYASAYESALTTAQAIERINEEYRQKAKDLGAKITDEQKTNLLKLRDDAVNAVKDEALQKTETYKELSKETLELTRQQVKEQIKILKSLMADGTITGDAKTQIQNQLGKLEFFLKVGVNQANLDALTFKLNGLKDRLKLNSDLISPEEIKRTIKQIGEVEAKIRKLQNVSNGLAKSNFAKGLAQNFAYLKGSTEDVARGVSKDLGQVSGAFGELSNAFGGIDTQAGYALATVSDIAGVGADAAGAFASFASGDIVGGVTGAIKAVTGLFSIGKRVKEMNAAAKKEVADFYANAISGERVYQDLLAKRALQNIRDNKTVLKGISDEVKLRRQQLNEYAKETAEIMAKLQGQSSIESETYKHGTWLRKAKVNKTYASLSGKTFEQLSQLLAQGKLEGDAKALVERLKEIEEKGYDAQQALAEIARETSEIFTGTSADNLTNSLLDMFKSGKTGVEDLAKFFKSTMDEAALSIFKNKVLSDMMLKFYDEFDKAAQSDEELTESEIQNLQSLFTSLTDDAKRKFENLKKVTGSDLTDPDDENNPNNVKSGIQGMNQQTAEVIAGQFGGQRIATLEGNEIARANGATAMEQLAQMKANALVLIKIENNTSRSADAEESYLPYLKSIDAKLNNTNSNPLRATGNG